MGIFSFNYDKPGKGVDANAPQKRGFFLYWELIFDRIPKHLQLNLFWAFSSIPWFLILFFTGMYFCSANGVLRDWCTQLAASYGSDSSEMMSVFSMSLSLFFATEIMLLWGSGPSSAMYAFVARCFSRREPVWIMSDGFDKIKENFKQGMLMVVIDYLVCVMGYVAITFYYSQYLNTGALFWLFVCTVTAVALVIYTWAHFYVYQLMVTYEGSLFGHIKNALIFAFANLPMNLFCFLIALLVSGGLFLLLNPVFAMFIVLIICPAFLKFMIEFTAARKIKKVVNLTEKKVKITSINGEGTAE